MLKNLKLRGQLIAGYTVPIILYTGIAGVVYATASKVVNTFQEVERVQNVIVETNQMALGAQGMVRNLRGYLITPENTTFLQEYRASYEATLASAKKSENYIRNDEQRNRLARMVADVNGYYEKSNQIINFQSTNRRNDALRVFREGQATQHVTDFDRVSQEFLDTERTVLSQVTRESREALQSLTFMVIVGTLILIALAIAFAWLISSGVARTVNQAANAIASASSEIAATVEQQERTTTQQAASVSETTTTMDELSASSRQSAEQAEATVAAARQALTLTESGTKTVQLTIQGMETLKERVSAIADQILRLSEQMGQIGNISQLVSDLANQTNMLALNAAVEAVRAGEHGKGFAVVAAEIRKLADQSKNSAQKINILVSDVQNAINLTVMVTDEGTKTVDESSKTSQKTVEAFVGVSDAVNNVMLNNQQISLNVKQQSIAIQQVVEAMNALNRGAQETASGMTQTRLGTHNLNEAAINLKSLV